MEKDLGCLRGGRGPLSLNINTTGVDGCSISTCHPCFLILEAGLPVDLITPVISPFTKYLILLTAFWLFMFGHNVLANTDGDITFSIISFVK